MNCFPRMRDQVELQLLVVLRGRFTGPCHWPNANGLHQSPINIDLGCVKRVTNYAPLKFHHYSHPFNGEIVNNGHSVQITPQFTSDAPKISGGGLDQVYHLVQYHFHWGQQDSEGSEHTLAGLHYPAELHLVHKGDSDPEKIAVVAVFLILGSDDKALKVEAGMLEKVAIPSSSATIEHAVVEHKLPHNKNSFWRYTGSLTTPPCSEGVTWTVFTEPVSITKEQLALFRSVRDKPDHVLEKNYRPVQKLNDREYKATAAVRPHYGLGVIWTKRNERDVKKELKEEIQETVLVGILNGYLTTGRDPHSTVVQIKQFKGQFTAVQMADLSALRTSNNEYGPNQSRKLLLSADVAYSMNRHSTADEYECVTLKTNL
uniref:Carbonic anhydrase n=1 Tax=Ascaris lumbricoides TaxID=6252 RepID=A0A0M3HYF4_ASCLU